LLLSASVQAGDFGFSEWLLAPVRVHLWTSVAGDDLHTTLSEADVERIVGKVNKVWAHAGLAFYVESVVREAPVQRNRLDGNPGSVDRSAEGLPEPSPMRYVDRAHWSGADFNVYYLKRFKPNGLYAGGTVFVKDTASLRPVEGGIEEPLPRVTSHELGHALGLVHRQDTFNLMASGTTGTLLNGDEISAARARAVELGRFVGADALLDEAQRLAGEGKVGAARERYARLVELPMDSAKLSRLREWLQQHPR